MSQKYQILAGIAAIILLVGGYLAFNSLKGVGMIPAPEVVNLKQENTNIQTGQDTAENATMPVSMDQSDAPSSSSNAENYEGVHIMPDGTVMKKNGDTIPDAVILANGTIQMSDGTIVTPAIDMREKSDAAVSVSQQHHVEFDVEGKDYEYNLNQIKVKKGDTVTINFKSTQGFHDWVIDELGVATERVNDGEHTSITFTADKTGTFQYYCSVMNHRQKGMIGYLVVE